MKGMFDPYLYPNTNVLANKLDVKDNLLLKIAEGDLTAIRIKEIVKNPIKGNYDFKHFCAFHHHIFQDLYDWAGEPRVVNIAKKEEILEGRSIEYTPGQYIERAASYAFSDMKSTDWSNMQFDAKVEALAKHMTRIWKIHPFREGNTRTVVTFCNQFAQSKGLFLDTKYIANNSAYLRNCLVKAAASFIDLGDMSNPKYLVDFLKDAAEMGAKERSQRLTKKPDHNRQKDNYMDR